MWNEGELFRFKYIYRGCDLNDRLAIYLGESHIKKAGGGTIRNFIVQVVGEDTPTICDVGLKKHMKKVEA